MFYFGKFKTEKNIDSALFSAYDIPYLNSIFKSMVFLRNEI